MDKKTELRLCNAAKIQLIKELKHTVNNDDVYDLCSYILMIQDELELLKKLDDEIKNLENALGYNDECPF